MCSGEADNEQPHKVVAYEKFIYLILSNKRLITKSTRMTKNILDACVLKFYAIIRRSPSLEFILCLSLFIFTITRNVSIFNLRIELEQ